jgi:hypothetical protein
MYHNKYFFVVVEEKMESELRRNFERAKEEGEIALFIEENNVVLIVQNMDYEDVDGNMKDAPPEIVVETLGGMYIGSFPLKDLAGILSSLCRSSDIEITFRGGSE